MGTGSFGGGRRNRGMGSAFPLCIGQDTKRGFASHFIVEGFRPSLRPTSPMFVNMLCPDCQGLCTWKTTSFQAIQVVIFPCMHSHPSVHPTPNPMRLMRFRINRQHVPLWCAPFQLTMHIMWNRESFTFST